MLEDRNIKYPSYVLAALLGYIAFIDATNAITWMQAPNASASWVIDLLTCGVCAVLGTLLLMRPHLYFFAPVVGWSLIAFLANLIMKAKGLDAVASQRMVLYFIVFVVAGTLTAIDGWKWWQAEQAKRPAPWAGGPWPGQYPGMPPQPYAPGQPYPPQQPPYAPQQYAPPPPPPAPEAPPAPPASHAPKKP